jgi:hypothetical protein
MNHEEASRAFEAKRVATDTRNRSYRVGDYARIDAGVMPCGEDVDLPTMLANADRRERMHALLMLAGAITVLALFAAPWFLGMRDILHKVFGR